MRTTWSERGQLWNVVFCQEGTHTGLPRLHATRGLPAAPAGTHKLHMEAACLQLCTIHRPGKHNTSAQR